MSARRVALSALNEWEDTSRYAENILSDLAAKGNLSTADRGLALDLLYGTIRNLFLLDEVIDRLRRGRIKDATRNILRIGLYQLLCSDIAEHAAIHETVELSRRHERGLVNAILRNAQRQKADLLAEIPEWPPEDRFSHPQFLIDRWTGQYGEETALDLCRWNNEPPRSYARINRLHPDAEAIKRVESETRPSWIGDSHPDFFAFTGAPDADWIDEGLVYVQDPSTSLSCRLLAPRPDERILDACAAPGGKTSLLAAMIDGRASIVAADNSPPRLERTRQNLDRLHVPGVEIRALDWTSEEFDPESLPRFDAILLDVPCSNTGVMRRRIDVRWRLEPDDFARQATIQRDLLERATALLRPGGRIVYSTCSIDREENEAVVEASGATRLETLCSLPWRDGFDGAFAALLRP